MAKASRSKSKSKAKTKRRFRPIRWVLRWLLRAVSAAFLVAVLVVLLWSVVNPPTTWYMMQESRRLGAVDQAWVPMEEIAPVMARAA
ncbi:MAG: monofunctional biosynthetic peptidoglycan transglycosylase, partial [Pseudomonadota bacterium]